MARTRHTRILLSATATAVAASAIGVLAAGLTPMPAQASAAELNLTQNTTQSAPCHVTNIAPGDNGTCTYIVTYTGSDEAKLSLQVQTSAHAATTSGVGSSPLLDGTATGLQIAITDSKNTTYGVGAITCTPASGTTPASCSSAVQTDLVASHCDNNYTNTFTTHWSLPLGTPNAYQGTTATVTLTALVTQTEEDSQ